MKVFVVKAHISNYPNPIKFKIGDPLYLGEEDKEYRNWIKVTTSCGNCGWAPIQYISKNGIAIFEYDATELNTVKGEELEVLFELNSWYRAVNSTGHIGWVPLASVKSA